VLGVVVPASGPVGELDDEDEGDSQFELGGAVGDVFGSWMFERVGLPLCLVVDAAATLAMFAVVLRVPDSVLASRDGEPEPTETPQPVLVGQGIAA